jgi:thiamine biosynthesis lipoprotein
VKKAYTYIMSKKNVILLVLLVPLVFAGCTPKQLHTEEAFKIHTLVQLTTYGSLKASNYHEVWKLLDTIDHTMSMSLKGSEIYSVNEAAGKHPLVVSEKTFEVVEAALKYSEVSSKFDITIGPLIELWGIGSDDPYLPTLSEIEEKLSYINYRDVNINAREQSIYLEREGMKIDLGGIAKGYAVDKTKELLSQFNIKSGIINFGGDLYLLGTKEDGSNWNVGIQHPVKSRGSFMGVLSASDRAVVTSGVYERYFLSDNIRYHHILDPHTGYPADNGVASVTVVSSTAMEADVFSTMLLAEGLERALEILEALEDTEGIIILENNQVYVTSGLKESFRITDFTFTLMP